MLTVAACEAALALALVSALYRMRKTLDMIAWHDLGEPEPASADEVPEEETASAYRSTSRGSRRPAIPADRAARAKTLETSTRV